MESIHQGHRGRIKQRFSEFGLENFSDIEALELLLYYAIPRRDTNELAHLLLERFGSFRGVMEARIEDLSAVPGIGENAALLIRLVTELNRRYLISGHNRSTRIKSSKEAGAYLVDIFSYEIEEVAYMICLDAGGCVIQTRALARGMVNRVDFSVRDIVDLALRYNAASVILAHNHVDGSALPSGADISASQRLRSALNLIGVDLSDHIIVCDSDYFSLRDSGYFD